MADNIYKTILDNIFEGIYFVDKDRNITFWNKGAEEITGFSYGEVKGNCCADNILRHVDNFGIELCIQGCPLSETLKDGKIREANVYLHHKDGHRVPVTIRISPIYDDENNIIGAAELFKDISSQKQMISELEELKKEVYLDHLTGIGNRKYGEMNLRKVHRQYEEYAINYGLIFIDIDNFKKLNDTYGHKAGDKVLQMVAKTLLNALRPLDMVYRMGGEEFIVIIPNCDTDSLKGVAERIRMLVENSFLTFEDNVLKVTISLGASISRAGCSYNKLIKEADEKMYISKKNGKNRVTI